MKSIESNYYSRQLLTYGIDVMNKLSTIKVLIVGMRGLGVETAKNLILAGVQKVDIYDPMTIEIRDLGSNFYLSEIDVGNKSRADASFEKLKTLNDYVSVNIVNEEINEEI